MGGLWNNAQQLGALDTLPQGMDSVPSSHMVATQLFITPAPEKLMLSLPASTGIRLTIQTCVQTKYTHKMNLFFLNGNFLIKINE